METASIPSTELYAKIEIKIPTRDASEKALKPLINNYPIDIELKYTGSYRLKQMLEHVISLAYPIQTGDPEYVVAYRWCLEAVIGTGGYVVYGFNKDWKPLYPIKGYYVYIFIIPVRRLNIEITHNGENIDEVTFDENISLYHEYGRLIDTE
jgi:hypothetical protein